MTSGDLLVDAFGRVPAELIRVIGALTPEQLAFRVDDRANSIGWLAWHLTRIQDDHLAAAASAEQVWLAGGWAERFGLPFDVAATGYAHSSADVARVRVTWQLLRGYADAVHQSTVTYVTPLVDADLERIVDTRWSPPVTLGVRLVSVVADGLQHVGQAAFIRGIVERA